VTGRTFDIRFGDAVVRVDQLADGTVQVSGVPVQVESMGRGQWRVLVDGVNHRVFAAGPDDAPWIWIDGVVYRPEVADVERPARVRSADLSGSLAAPMPATVRAINVKPGDRVSRGDTLVVLEAMKMELPLKSPTDGVVVSVACQVGDLVQPGVPLVEMS
jgi:3-methylcrotonyl-CoA carboxylase alpha subunit